MDRHRLFLALLPLCLAIVWCSSGTEGVSRSEIDELLKKAKGDIMRLDIRKLKPQCRKAMSKCRAKALVIIQVLKIVQENPEPYLESQCLMDYLRNGIFDIDRECDMNGTYGEEMQCFRDPIMEKNLGPKYSGVGAFVNCMSENALNYDPKNPRHVF